MNVLCVRPHTSIGRVFPNVVMYRSTRGSTKASYSTSSNVSNGSVMTLVCHYAMVCGECGSAVHGPVSSDEGAGV